MKNIGRFSIKSRLKFIDRVTSLDVRTLDEEGLFNDDYVSGEVAAHASRCKILSILLVHPQGNVSC